MILHQEKRLFIQLIGNKLFSLPEILRIWNTFMFYPMLGLKASLSTNKCSIWVGLQCSDSTDVINCTEIPIQFDALLQLNQSIVQTNHAINCTEITMQFDIESMAIVINCIAAQNHPSFG